MFNPLEAGVNVVKASVRKGKAVGGVVLETAGEVLKLVPNIFKAITKG